jgi:uncharacterized protein
MKPEPNHYVYAYFDPRNYEMFYVGKGQNDRKDAHRSDKAGTVKERRIAEIKKAGLEPNIKVVAVNLTEDQAFLVEAALMWRPRESLTNLTRGNYSENFRPPNTLHLWLPGFDTTRRVYFVNVGYYEDNRNWVDCRKLGFLAAGYGRRFSSQLDRLEVGAIAAAYVSKHGYVGIGRVVAPSVPLRDFRFKGRSLTRHMLKGKDLLHHSSDTKKCDYLVKIKWIETVPLEGARTEPGLYAKQPIVASLSRQPKTLEFLQREFNVNFERLLAAN